jgi:NhaP-type Na+/H+ or K+/H+ antiporter
VLVALAFYEAYRHLTYPIFPPAIFKNLRVFTTIVVGVLFLGLNYSSAAILWPPQVNMLYTQEPVSYAWYIGIVGVAGTLAAAAIGFIFLKAADHAGVLLTAIAASLTTFSALQALVSKYLMSPFQSGR